ncbi:hypothetical protein BD310DRAFT_588734 [Dichomitus squalens]|uniref:F-box domain-containing protein n=1 Tax=Dichomitus squalens TaxID=114155 RepID=A0A4Q9PRF6_9APHY|nr:hypothetical protein BD310DRAFT_588734 [Dichomitus squalens]
MSPEDNMSNSPDFSPSDSPTMQSLVLPVEVIEGIIDCCSYYTDTLLAFALTCRDLHPRSILVLFTEVRLRSRDRVLDFCDVLKAKPERQSIVQSLSLRWEAFAPHPLLSILSALRQITFGGRVCDPVQCHPSTLLCCRQSGSGLRSLTIQGATFPTCTAFLHFLSAFHSIEHLTCEGLQLKQKGEANPFVQHQLSRQLRLRTLNVGAIMGASVFLVNCDLDPFSYRCFSA